MDAIKLLKQYNEEEYIPTVLKREYELVYRFDTVSLLNYYKGIITNAALERMTVINQKQLQHYAPGLKKPHRLQARKIQHALHELGKELLAVEL